MGNIEDITIKSKWTDDISNKDIDDFVIVLKQVFGTEYNHYKFQRKYMNNIYGSSLIILAYVGEKCVAVRTFWRNDIEGSKAYQPCDTAVLEEYRGLGLFTKMTRKALGLIEQESVIFNFPNDNSLPGYLKMGWSIKSKHRYKFYNKFKDNASIDMIENEYMRWLLTDNRLDFNKSLYYTISNSSYYLLKRKSYNLYVIIGEFDATFANKLRKAKCPICLYYSQNGYLGRGLVTVVKNLSENNNIPFYKVDTIF